MTCGKKRSSKKTYTAMSENRYKPHHEAADRYDDEVKAYNSYLHDVVFGMSFEYVRSGEKLLDIGIGTGLSSKQFADAGLKVYGLDISKEMLEVCCAKSFTEELVQCDIAGKVIPFPNRFFHHVICCGVLHFLSDLSLLFSEATRIQKKKGIFAFTIIPNETDAAFIKEPTAWGIPIFRHSPSYVHELLEANNLKLLKEQRLLIKGADKENYNILFSSLVCGRQ
jgi:predicted TPR repeat methyltransferase